MNPTWFSGYSTRLVAIMCKYVPRSNPEAGKNFSKKGYAKKRGVIPQGTRGGLRGAQRSGQGRYGSPVNQKL
jgi:hypothetical protein